jgi:Glycosyl transferase family 8
VPGNDSDRDRVAFAFYATDDSYAFSALVFLELLRDLGIRPDAEVVVLHLPLSAAITGLMREAGMRIIAVEPLEPRRDPYYRHSLVKLRIFELTAYVRVLFVDSDSIPLKNLDDLISYPLSGPVSAPRAYWLEHRRWTTGMLLAQPSPSNWARITRHVATTAPDDHFDMDVINDEFADEIGTLPNTSFCLNSEWEVAGRPGHFADPDEAYTRVSVVHFTALGKPWMYSTDEVRKLRPHAHPAFYEMWDKWHATRRAILAGRTRRS